jgi:hypothetical protein
VPLSDHEQRLLDQIERALYQEDPKFASTVRSTDLRTHMKRRMRRAAFLFGLGVVLLLGGLVNNQPAVGIGGFVVMVAALALALSSWKRLGTAPSQGGLRAVGSDRPARTKRSKSSTSSSGGSILKRLEERWTRRWDERGQ